MELQITEHLQKLAEYPDNLLQHYQVAVADFITRHSDSEKYIMPDGANFAVYGIHIQFAMRCIKRHSYDNTIVDEDVDLISKMIQIEEMYPEFVEETQEKFIEVLKKIKEEVGYEWYATYHQTYPHLLNL